MVLGGKVWNKKLNIDDRKLLLIAVTYFDVSKELINIAAKLEWSELPPKIQEELLARDWSMILDRDVRPEGF